MRPSQKTHLLSPKGALRALLPSLLLAVTPAAADNLPVFKIFIDTPGPYRVSFEDLEGAGLKQPGLPSEGLGLFHKGHPFPVWVEDGGDGIFGPGDWLELLGELPQGWVSHISEDTRYNVYFLRFDADDPLRMTVYRPGPVDSSQAVVGNPLRRHRHYENDFLLQRVVPSRNGRPDERWYWAKLSHLSGDPFAHTLDTADLAAERGSTVDLSIELRGWSQPRHKSPGMADHRLEVLLNGYEIGAAEWDGTESHLVELTGIAAHWFNAGDNQLTLKIPRRILSETGNPLIDVVMLNWIEINYPRLAQVGGPAADFRLSETYTGPMRLLTPRTGNPEADDFVLYGRNGSRLISNSVEPRDDGEWAARVFFPAEGERSFVTVSPGHIPSPQAIVRERSSRLSATSNRADYIMIAHRRLLTAIQPLATFHRSRGLDVEVVDIQDVYDEFSGGLARPWAMRDFLEHAYHRWQKPAPRFVLLVGDASLNAKDVLVGDGSFPDHVLGATLPDAPRAPEIESDDLKYTPYDQDTDLINRHLIPTWSYATVLGHAASDNHFADVDGEDDLPDLAIGRLAVVEPAEVTAIIDKTIRYASTPEVGPWRRNVVFLTNTLNKFHRQSRWVAGYSAAAGFKTQEIYPSLEEPDNEQYTRQLTESLNEGQLFVHYMGHGGRYIWETGRRDLKQNRDLFSLENLDALAPTNRLPVVLSLTCFTAPFDHPHADSLGEKLVRLADRGAIAVIAASQSNGPSGSWGQVLLDELTQPGATIGEAMMRAKREIRIPDFVKVYNLLGDPAVPVALPAAKMALSLSNGDGRPLTVSGTVDANAFTGELLVELADENRELLHTVNARLDGFEFAVEIEAPAETLAATRVVRAYAWDTSRGIDAAGAVELSDEPRDQPKPPRYRKLVPNYGEDDAPATAAEPREILADTVAWWSFEESGDDVSDRAGKFNGSLVGRANREDRPRLGNALSLAGRGFVDFGHDSGLDLGTGDFTLHAWISTRQAQRQLWVILDKRTDIGYHLYNYWGQLGLQIADEAATNYDGPFIADGRWRHIAVTVDRDRPDGIRWYVDGREAAPRQDPTAHQGSLDNPAPLTVGGRHHGGGNFVGEIDEVGIFKRALTARDVERLYESGWSWLQSSSGQVAQPSAP